MLFGLILSLVLFFGLAETHSSNSGNEKSPAELRSGTLQKMIVKSGSATMEIDLNRLNGVNSMTKEAETLDFAVALNSFFPIVVFENALRGSEPGTMRLIAQSNIALPGLLSESLNQLSIEKLDSSAPFDLVVRDGESGFVFFDVEGDLYDYDAGAQLLSIQGGRLLISKEFAKELGRPSTAGLVVGKIFRSGWRCSR